MTEATGPTVPTTPSTSPTTQPNPTANPTAQATQPITAAQSLRNLEASITTFEPWQQHEIELCGRHINLLRAAYGVSFDLALTKASLLIALAHGK